MRFSMLSVLRARNEYELTFPTLTRRAIRQSIASINLAPPIALVIERQRDFYSCRDTRIYEVAGKPHWNLVSEI